MLDDTLADKYRSTFEKALLRLTAGLTDDDVLGRAGVHARMRESNENIIAQNAEKLGPEGAAILRDVLDTVISESNAETQIPVAVHDHPASKIDDRSAKPDAGPASSRSVAMGVLLGICISGLLAFVLSWLGAMNVSADIGTAGRTRDFEERFAQSYPKVEIAAGFLELAEKEIIRRQQTDGPTLAAIAGEKFVPIATVSQDLVKRIPPEMPANTVLLVRADAQAYKIVFRSALCTATEFVRPELIDPVRKSESLGCEFFGVWNALGEKF